jgi:uncharacterized protein YndB with AHSA1/START domain
MAPKPAALRTDGDRHALRFERELPQPAERVWSALTETSQLAEWHPTPFEFEPARGGRVRFRSEPGGPRMPDGEVRDYDPPRLLSYTWGEDLLRWELQPRGDGCLLVLTHTFDDRFKAARDAAGWHLCLDALAAVLAGERATPARERADSPRIPEAWSALNRDYERRFRIPAEKATPPPG